MFFKILLVAAAITFVACYDPAYSLKSVLVHHEVSLEPHIREYHYHNHKLENINPRKNVGMEYVTRHEPSYHEQSQNYEKRDLRTRHDPQSHEYNYENLNSQNERQYKSKFGVQYDKTTNYEPNHHNYQVHQKENRELPHRQFEERGFGGQSQCCENHYSKHEEHHNKQEENLRVNEFKTKFEPQHHQHSYHKHEEHHIAHEELNSSKDVINHEIQKYLPQYSNYEEHHKEHHTQKYEEYEHETNNNPRIYDHYYHNHGGNIFKQNENRVKKQVAHDQIATTEPQHNETQELKQKNEKKPKKEQETEKDNEEDNEKEEENNKKSGRDKKLEKRKQKQNKNKVSTEESTNQDQNQNYNPQAGSLLKHHFDYNTHPIQFAYGIKDTNNYNIKHHRELRDGDVVTGEYSLLQPDGTIRIVEYHAYDKKEILF